MKYRVLLRESLHETLVSHLSSGFKQGNLQEEACLALWRLGDGYNRYTGILGEVMLPKIGDRDLHGNVTVHGEYLNRVLDQAVNCQAGVAVLHSHPSKGWQALSRIDDDTERTIIAPFVGETGLPLLGMTMGKDGVWSARFWQKTNNGRFQLNHCTNVRRIGVRGTQCDSPPGFYPPYERRPTLVRTLDCWGSEAQAKLARTHVCVVGAGSVGSILIEALARIGIEELSIIDEDLVEERNLDRLIYADKYCVGLFKAELAAARARRVSTANHPLVRAVPLSIRTETAYRIASDADLIVCCVDNAEARDVLNHIAYAGGLPLIDGGVLVDSDESLLSAKWRIHLVGPDMACLRCRVQYTSSDARDERMKLRQRGRYIQETDRVSPEPGQNTIAFCCTVAANVMQMLVRYVIGKDWWHDKDPKAGYWAFEHRFVEAQTELFEHPSACVASCEFTNVRVGRGVNGRPHYPFADLPPHTLIHRVKRRLINAKANITKALYTLLSA